MVTDSPAFSVVIACEEIGKAMPPPLNGVAAQMVAVVLWMEEPIIFCYFVSIKNKPSI
jgi:hypothetical protein